ncbi:MAG: bifunctional nuclease family protein [Dethiobacter sp.]|jgi:bifunctional DNase/RNase|nr:bifunctional nuclease family protein [Dethiobacter sp.]
MLEMKVKAVTISQSGELTILLSDREEKKILPIVIGALEAHNIAIPLQGEVPPRPLTHDLLKSAINHLGGEVEKIIITDIRDNTYFAEIYIRHNNSITAIDSRPSDAIALALRCGAGIYMSPRLIEFTYEFSDIVVEGDHGTH